MRRTVRRTLFLLGLVSVLLLVPGVAVAHPLGNFTVNTSAAIVVTPGAVRVDYVLDMAEIPTVQAMPKLDADGDGIVSGAEGSAWADERASELLTGLTLTVDGTRVAIEASDSGFELLPGQGGLRTLRLESTFIGEIGSRGALAFQDSNFTDRVGWHEVTAVGADGVAIEGASVPATSVTDRLRAYPQDLLSSPLDVREATLGFAPGRSSPETPSTTEPSGASARPGMIGGSFAGLVERNGPLMFVAPLLALGFGALHALGPGHGKTLMAAYLVGGGGRVRQALAVGGAVAVMHTASVLALGFFVLSATRVFAPERVYPWLGVASGLIALTLGAGLLVVRLGIWGQRRRVSGHPHGDHGPDHGAHDHGDHAHTGHRHPHPTPDAPAFSRRGLVALAVAGGILPSPTALVVLLASVAVHRVAYGLALIAAFSLGLALALVGVGVLALGARGLVERRMSGRIARVVPVISAAAIAALGIVLTVSGASQL